MPQTKGNFYFFSWTNNETIFEGEQDGHETDPGGLNEMRNL